MSPKNYSELSHEAKVEAYMALSFDEIKMMNNETNARLRAEEQLLKSEKKAKDAAKKLAKLQKKTGKKLAKAEQRAIKLAKKSDGAVKAPASKLDEAIAKGEAKAEKQTAETDSLAELKQLLANGHPLITEPVTEASPTTTTFELNIEDENGNKETLTANAAPGVDVASVVEAITAAGVNADESAMAHAMKNHSRGNRGRGNRHFNEPK